MLKFHSSGSIPHLLLHSSMVIPSGFIPHVQSVAMIKSCLQHRKGSWRTGFFLTRDLPEGAEKMHRTPDSAFLNQTMLQLFQKILSAYVLYYRALLSRPEATKGVC